MQSSEWTPDRFRARIQDHLRWAAACEAVAIRPASPPEPPFSSRRRWKQMVRKGILGVPFAGPALLSLLRRLEARLRRRSPSPG